MGTHLHTQLTRFAKTGYGSSKKKKKKSLGLLYLKKVCVWLIFWPTLKIGHNSVYYF